MAQKKRSSSLPTDSTTMLIGLLGAVLIVALLVLWVFPPFSERGSAKDAAASAEAIRDGLRTQLAEYSNNSGSFQELVTRAQIADGYVPFFDPAEVQDPIAEMNLVYPRLFEAAAASIGQGDIRASFPVAGGGSTSSGKTTTPPRTQAPQTTDGTDSGTSRRSTIAYGTISVTLTGGSDAPARFVEALRAQGILATVVSADVSASAPQVPLNETSEYAIRLTLRLWYSTTPPVDIDRSVG